MDRLILKNIRLKGKHGCFAHELETPCEFRVSMVLYLNLEAAGKTDRLDDTIDYPAAASIAEGVIAGESVRLMETLAARIAERMFIRFGQLAKIKVKVQKCGACPDFATEEVSVQIARKRKDFFA